MDIQEKSNALGALLGGVEMAIGNGTFKSWDDIETMVDAKRAMVAMFQTDLPQLIRNATVAQQLNEAAKQSQEPRPADFESPKTIKRK